MKLSRRNQKLLLRTLLALAMLLAGFLSESPLFNDDVVKLSPGTYRVESFHDGDTISVKMDDKAEIVRFIGVDTPETHDPRKAVQCFGMAAADFTKRFIGEQPVRLEADPLSSNRDRYDRLLRYVYIPDGRLVQAEIIKQGYGFAYTSFPFTKSEEFSSYQREAREQNKGLWSNCEPTANEFGGLTSNDAVDD